MDLGPGIDDAPDDDAPSGASEPAQLPGGMLERPSLSMSPSPPDETQDAIRHPEVVVRLTGGDGNAFAVLGAVRRALREAGHADEVDEFFAEATSGDYDTLLRTCMRWVTIH
jgi:hypothetical protein